MRKISNLFVEKYREARQKEVADARGISASELSVSGVTEVYANTSNLPLSSVSAGTLAYVEYVSSLYFYSGSGWYKISVINTNPNITTGPDATYEFAIDGTPIVITLEATDPESIPITWSYSVTSGSLGSTATVSQADNVFTITPSTNTENAGEFSITFTASDGVNLATATSSFTLSFGVADQYYNSTSLMLKSKSTAGLNNHTFVDESTNSYTITRNGDVYQGSYSPYSPAGWSAYFDGTGDYLTIPDDDSLDGFDDFTIECWVYLNSTGNGQTILDGGWNGAAVAPYLIWVNGGIINLYAAASSGSWSLQAQSFGAPVANVWTHIAVTREGTTARLFRDGVLITTAALSGTLFNAATTKSIGGTANGSYLLNGYVSNLRIVKGTALYTSAFTPSTFPLTTTSQGATASEVSLLTCQSSIFIDNSTNNFTITRNGDTKLLPSSLLLPSEKYDPTVHGGSAYFDGSDYLETPSNVAFDISGTNSTVECWFLATSLPSNLKTLVASYNGSSGGSFYLGIDGSNKINIRTGNDASVVTGTTTIIANTWYHVALVRDGATSAKVYLNGTLEISSASFSWTAYTQACYIGTYAGGVGPFTGYISNVRLVKGTAVYTANFTPPTQPLTAISGTSLLLNMNNAGIYDETSKNNIKVIGNATTSTTQTKYNNTSVYFDGTGDGLVIPGSNVADFNTGNFTLEMHVYIVANSATYQCFYNSRNVGSGFFFGLLANTRRLMYYSGAALITDADNLDIGVWYHTALVRNNGLTTLYKNGVSVGTYNDTINYTSTQAELGRDTAYGFDLNAYLSDVRITKGVARYTSNFTPPTAALGFRNDE